MPERLPTVDPALGRHGPARPRSWAPILALAFLPTACSPTLDWRDVRLPGVGLGLLFPCKPKSEVRAVEVSGQAWSAALSACEAGGMTFAALALTAADEPPGTVAAADRQAMVLDMARHAEQRWGPVQGDPHAPTGVSLPQGLPQAQWSRHLKNAPGAAPTITQALFLATPQGLVQLSVQGGRLSETALENFFGQLRVLP